MEEKPEEVNADPKVEPEVKTEAEPVEEPNRPEVNPITEPTEEPKPEIKPNHHYIELESEAKPDPEPECIGWRCWECLKVYKLDEECRKCYKEIGDFEGADFNDVMVYEKKE